MSVALTNFACVIECSHKFITITVVVQSHHCHCVIVSDTNFPCGIERSHKFITITALVQSHHCHCVFVSGTHQLSQKSFLLAQSFAHLSHYLPSLWGWDLQRQQCLLLLYRNTVCVNTVLHLNTVCVNIVLHLNTVCMNIISVCFISVYSMCEYCLCFFYI